MYNYINLTIKSIFIIIISTVIIVSCAFINTLKEGLTNKHQIILLGDSVLNNSNYVPLNTSVEDILKTKTLNVINFSKDGAKIADLQNQLNNIALKYNSVESHIFISAGGNDILNNHSQFDLLKLNNLFNTYLDFIKTLKNKFNNSKIYILNLYLPPKQYFQTYKKSVEKWNEIINMNSTIYKVIDLHSLLYQSEDFVFNIEPSEIASEKIANIIYSKVI
jgi:hypothetical protein